MKKNKNLNSLINLPFYADLEQHKLKLIDLGLNIQQKPIIHFPPEIKLPTDLKYMTYHYSDYFSFSFYDDFIAEIFDKVEDFGLKSMPVKSFLIDEQWMLNLIPTQKDLLDKINLEMYLSLMAIFDGMVVFSKEDLLFLGTLYSKFDKDFLDKTDILSSHEIEEMLNIFLKIDLSLYTPFHEMISFKVKCLIEDLLTSRNLLIFFELSPLLCLVSGKEHNIYVEFLRKDINE